MQVKVCALDPLRKAFFLKEVAFGDQLKIIALELKGLDGGIELERVIYEAFVGFEDSKEESYEGSALVCKGLSVREIFVIFEFEIRIGRVGAKE